MAQANDPALFCLQENQGRCDQLQQQVTELLAANLQLQRELDTCRKGLQEAAQDKEEAEAQLRHQKKEKEAARKELSSLSEKVKSMEESYRREMEQSQRIKGELLRFWEKKERKEELMRDLGPRKQQARRWSGCSHDQSTFILSEKEWRVRGCQQVSSMSNLHGKENLEYREGKW
jgi:chromosome segregation ATPase